MNEKSYALIMLLFVLLHTIISVFIALKVQKELEGYIRNCISTNDTLTAREINDIENEIIKLFNELSEISAKFADEPEDTITVNLDDVIKTLKKMKQEEIR